MYDKDSGTSPGMVLNSTWQTRTLARAHLSLLVSSDGAMLFRIEFLYQTVCVSDLR